MQELEKQFHIHCVEGDIGKYVILAGDPGRIPAIAELFDDAKQIAYNREFNVYTGYLEGVKVTACSTGIGGPSTSIAVASTSKGCLASGVSLKRPYTISAAPTFCPAISL